ncbi:MAG: hypothetical protein JRN53_05640 [Nitrososphaerota archaeon]|jgi:hypothetical protein|nr:hypothetical protein [Nitrososphaerota archaeon]MDG7047050.1 hypothetical protein [Nitrososphaerota archaeon]
MLRQEYADELRAIYERKKHPLLDAGINTFSGFVNDLIWHVIEADRVLSSKAPFLSEVGMTEDGVTLRDAKLDRIVEVKVRNGELVCDLDNSNDCVHVGFAYAIPEVYRVINMIGRKSSNVR